MVHSVASVQLPEPFASIPRQQLLFGQSPVHSLPRISAALGGRVRVYAKREDCNSGIAFGGNKTRKLEYLIPDARAKGCDTLVAIGGTQSNCTRQVAGVGAAQGFKVKLVQEKWLDKNDPCYDKVANIQLSRLMGAELRFDSAGFGIGHKDSLRQLCEEVQANGGKPYYIPAGASDHPLGGLGFARWAFEVRQQELDMGLFFDTIFTCVATGSTFGGMVAGFKYLEKKRLSPPRRVIGVDSSATPEETLDQIIRSARRTAVLIGLDESDIQPEDVIFDTRYDGGSYGVPGEDTIKAIQFGAVTEGFITDPVYGGKSFAGMIDMIRNGEVKDGSTVLYAQHGGQIALSAYTEVS